MTPGSFELPPPSEGPKFDELNPTDVLLMWTKFADSAAGRMELTLWQALLLEQALAATHAMLIRTPEVRERGLLK